MAVSVGGTTCTFVKGDPPPAAPGVVIYEIAGRYGRGFQLNGDDANRFFVRAIHFVEGEAAAEAFRLAMYALRATRITIVNDFGRTHQNLLVDQVRQIMKKRVFTDDIDDAYRVEIELSGYQVAAVP